ncbi:MAG: SRPBCC domain-containing protein [Aldersonia sp.]|nr:SRPBCC domain-containing protein [Aldersonia sp.]
MSDREFTISREFDAPRELVFRAWTDPEQLAKWCGPRGFHTPISSISMDARPGGVHRMTMVEDDSGDEYVSAGVYREIVPPERLVFTWGDPTLTGAEPEGTRGGEHESVITVTFAEEQGKTIMTFHLRAPGPFSPEDGAQEGWSQALDRLVEVVTTSPATPG